MEWPPGPVWVIVPTYNERANLEALVEEVRSVLERSAPDHVILVVDVYHEMDHPVEMLAAMRKSLSKGGRMALVEFRAEDVVPALEHPPRRRFDRWTHRRVLRLQVEQRHFHAGDYR